MFLVVFFKVLRRKTIIHRKDWVRTAQSLRRQIVRNSRRGRFRIPNSNCTQMCNCYRAHPSRVGRIRPLRLPSNYRRHTSTVFRRDVRADSLGMIWRHPLPDIVIGRIPGISFGISMLTRAWSEQSTWTRGW